MKREEIGTILSSFDNLSIPLAVLSIVGDDSYRLTYQTETPVFISPRQHSTISVKLETETLHLASEEYLTLPKETKFTILPHKGQLGFTIFSLSDELIHKVAEIYSLEQSQYLDLFSKTHLFKQKTWFNLLLSRYIFAVTVEKLERNLAEDFLSMEIVKELYYTYQDVLTPARSDIFPLDDSKIQIQNPKLESALTYIEENIFRDLTIEEICSKVGTSKVTLVKLFKDTFSKAPGQFIKDRKLQEAHIILRSSNYSIAEVAEMIGYKNTSAFNKAFKGKFNETPSEMLKREK